METSCALDSSAKSAGRRNEVDCGEEAGLASALQELIEASIISSVAPTEALRTGEPAAAETDTSTHVTELEAVPR